VYSVPEETKRVARAAFPKGNGYMMFRDEIGPMYADSEYAPLFAEVGRPAESPGRLAMICAMQFAEGLTDRQAADAVRSRIDWKYMLGLELTDPGFDFTVLSDFRSRVLEGSAEAQLLDDMLARFKAHGLIKTRGRQRTDSTHVLAATRTLNRLECVGETLRHALNTLAAVAPGWLRPQIKPQWLDRYGKRVEEYRLPRGKEERYALAEIMGADGSELLTRIYAADAPEWLRSIPAIETLRRVWVQQFYVVAGQLKWRESGNVAPPSLLIETPYDTEAHYSVKRETTWVGYKVHLTETCDEDMPSLITHVETTSATVPDTSVTDRIHADLAEKDLLPGQHLVDMGYPDADHLVTSRNEYGIDLCGPVRDDQSWQNHAQEGFAMSCFTIDWAAQRATCPAGKVSRTWKTERDRGHDVIRIAFASEDCTPCAHRSQCTQAKVRPRILKLWPQAQHTALQAARERQVTDEFKHLYAGRAGVEGTISQGTRTLGLRRARYIGQPKTHLQHVLTAASINLVRAIAWLQGAPREATRTSSFAALAST
jgi:transposase